jgi:hypothetical protein
MLDPWIIEEIKRREEERDRQPAVIELPLHAPPDRDKRDDNGGDRKKDDDPPRGIVIIDYSVGG